MAERTIDPTEFRKIFGDVPELTTPEKMVVNGKKQQWPFKTLKLDEGDWTKTGILQTEEHAGHLLFGESSSLIKVEYEEAYGIDVKKWLYLEKIGDETEINAGALKYTVDGQEIFYTIAYNSLFRPSSVNDLRDLHQFDVSINVSSIAQPEKKFPLACTVYEPYSTQPIHMQFPYADYTDACAGKVERPLPQPGYYPGYLSAYRLTYCEWEDFEGAKVGKTKYKDAECMRTYCYEVPTAINCLQLTEIPDTPYKAKMSRSKGFHQPGRLRFSRRNQDTGETWMLSVPERIDKHDFMNELQHHSIGDFLRLYPVVFCVKQPGEKRNWLSTSGNRDKAR